MKDQKKLKETLREKSELLSTEHRMLFRGKFQNFVTDNVKSKQNSAETFQSINRGKNHQLFSEGPQLMKRADGFSISSYVKGGRSFL